MQTSDVREAAQSAADLSKSFLDRQISERTTQLGTEIGSLARDLRIIGDGLKSNAATEPAAQYVERGADVVANVADYLRAADTERLITDLETLARERPWSVAAAALALGFAGSRFLKTSSTRRYRASAAYARAALGAVSDRGGEHAA